MTSVQYRGPKHHPAHQFENVEIKSAWATSVASSQGKKRAQPQLKEREGKIQKGDDRPRRENKETAARARERPEQPILPRGREEGRLELGIAACRKPQIGAVVADQRRTRSWPPGGGTRRAGVDAEM